METKKIRIAVCIDTDGDWAAQGGITGTETQHIRDVRLEVGDDSRLYWIEAELPVPEVETVRGEVKEVE